MVGFLVLRGRGVVPGAEPDPGDAPVPGADPSDALCGPGASKSPTPGRPLGR